MTETFGGEDITPNPQALIESLRDFGYTLPTAIADLIDNSLTAKATHVALEVTPGGGSSAHVAVLDNGAGMSLETLVSAMRLGTVGRGAPRAEHDLGRFGLGLKTASLSQGRRVTVITKTDEDREPKLRVLDIDHIGSTQSWQLSKEVSKEGEKLFARIAGQHSGTAVLIENLDRASFLRVAPHQLHEHLGQALAHVRDHLEMVFHRFLERGVRIQLGDTQLSWWDPFLRGKSVELPRETLPFKGQSILISPFVLPHHSKISDDEHRRGAGPRGWNAHQGFYIYRAHRLIVPGTWLNLSLKKEEHYKLARIVIDLPNSMDDEWHLNVIKSHVAAPAYLRDDLRRIGDKARKDAFEVYRFRGARQVSSEKTPERFVWVRENTRSGVRYRIDNSHPVVRALVHAGCQHEALLKNLLDLIEQTVPIAAMLQEPAKALDGAVAEAPSSETLDAYVEMVCHAEQFIIRAGKPPHEARRIVLSVEPFARYREGIVARLEELGGTPTLPSAKAKGVT